MGLDIDLYWFQDFERSCILKACYINVVEEMRRVRLPDLYNGPCLLVASDNWTLEQKQRCEQFWSDRDELAHALGASDDNGNFGPQHKIELPSRLNPLHTLGYWSGSSLNDAFAAVIERNLYDAFPGALLFHHNVPLPPEDAPDDPFDEWVRPDWQSSWSVLKDILQDFEASAPNGHFFALYPPQGEKGRVQIINQEAVDTLSPNELSIMRSAKRIRYLGISEDYVADLSLVLETVEYILVQPDPERYVLMWNS